MMEEMFVDIIQTHLLPYVVLPPLPFSLWGRQRAIYTLRFKNVYQKNPKKHDDNNNKTEVIQMQ